MHQRTTGLLVFLCACTSNTDLPTGVVVSCTSERDCPSGYICPVGVCYPKSAIANGAPTLQAAIAQSEVEVLLTFDKPLVQTGTDVTSNYAVAPSLTIIEASLAGEQQVKLLVSGMRAGETYTVTVQNLIGYSGLAIAEGGNQQTFVGFGIAPDTSAPEPLFPPRSSAQYIGDVGPILVGWAPKVGATSYTVQLDDEPTFSPPRVYQTTVNAPKTTAELLDALDDTTYYWRVRANVTAANTWGCSSFERIMTELHVYCDKDDCNAAPAPPPADPCAPLDVETGNRSTPFRSLQRAIDAAVVYDINRILVANHGGPRGYYAESFSLSAPVSLIGGYDSTFTTQDLGTPTRIVGTAATTLRIQGMGRDLYGWGPSTIIDNFDIEASTLSNPQPSLAVEITASGNDLAIRNCTITATASQRNIGMRVGFWVLEAPIIENSTIASVAPDSNSYGPGVEIIEASLDIRSSTISGSTGIDHHGYNLDLTDSTVVGNDPYEAAAVDIYGLPTQGLSSLKATHNVLRCLGTNNECYGVRFRESRSLQAVGNLIEVGPSNSGYGVWIEHPWSQNAYNNGDGLQVHNNVIVVADGIDPVQYSANDETVGVYVKNAGASITHNTILVGGGTTTYGGGITIAGIGNPVVYNNLIYLQSSTQARWAVQARGQSSEDTPRAISGNVFATAAWPADESGPPYVYWDSGGQALRVNGTRDFTSSKADGLDGLGTCTNVHVDFDASQTCFTLGTLVGTGNTKLSVALADLFVEPVGIDTELYLAEDGNFHLQAGTATSSGRALFGEPGPYTLSDCGANNESANCPFVSTDADDAARTLPVSSGAFERD